MAYKFRWPSLIYPSELWRILTGVMAGMLIIPLVESMHGCTVQLFCLLSINRDF